METQSAPTRTVIVGQPKSMGIALILTLLFGPLGMFYSSVLGGIIMFFVNLIAVPLTLGFALVVTWPVQLIWAAVAAHNHNKKIQNLAGSFV